MPARVIQCSCNCPSGAVVCYAAPSKLSRSCARWPPQRRRPAAASRTCASCAATGWRATFTSGWRRCCRQMRPATCRSAWACTARSTARTAAAAAACSWSCATCGSASHAGAGLRIVQTFGHVTSPLAVKDGHTPQRLPVRQLLLCPVLPTLQILHSAQGKWAGRGARQSGAALAGGLPCGVLGRGCQAAGAVGAGLLLAPGDQASSGAAGGAAGAACLTAHMAASCCCRCSQARCPSSNTVGMCVCSACRLEELDDIGREWRPLAAAAHELDRRLQATPFHTLCHGDFKTEVRNIGDAMALLHDRLAAAVGTRLLATAVCCCSSCDVCRTCCLATQLAARAAASWKWLHVS